MRTFQTVVSSNILGINYDKENKEVSVLYKGGAIYNYKDVPEESFNELENAESVGSHMHKFFKGKYECEKKESVEEIIGNDGITINCE